jgi:hypothetical protein
MEGHISIKMVLLDRNDEVGSNAPIVSHNAEYLLPFGHLIFPLRFNKNEHASL